MNCFLLVHHSVCGHLLAHISHHLNDIYHAWTWDSFDVSLRFILCVQVDRSPCGSGTTARIAVQFAKGQIGLGQERISQSGLTGSCFTAKVHAQTTCGDIPAVVVAVSGKAHYIGSSVFTLEEDDDQKGGFNIRWTLCNLRYWYSKKIISIPQADLFLCWCFQLQSVCCMGSLAGIPC